jgi:hypothetical protein
MTRETKSNSAKKFASCLLVYSLRLISDDYVWQLFGYKKRPKRGAWFNKFINQDKLNQEVFLRRELFIMCICLSVKSFYNLSNDLRRKILNNLLEILLSDNDIAGAFHFNTLHETHLYFEDGINEYLKTDITHYLIPFMARGTKFLADKFNGGWMVGIARMQQEINLPQILKENFDIPLIDDIA